MEDNMKQRQGFGTSFGMILAAAGSAIGVGNIWRFPYVTGNYGGAAFLIVYLVMIVAIGMPLMLAEVAIGRRGGEDASKSFKKLAPGSKWHISGLIGIVAAFIILGYYSVVAGWSLKYVVNSLTDVFSGMSPEQIGAAFGNYVSSDISPIVYALIIMGMTMFIVFKGVNTGIEKASKILLPILLLILIVLSVRSLTLKNAMAGLEFLFKPDFRTLLQSKDGILVAMGHAFYSLSLGMGIMVTYGSYMKKEENLGSAVLKISIMDTVVALLAGLVIFPAVFSFGLEPNQGPGLVFVTLPNVFLQMPGGVLFGSLFFLLLTFAAITSTISLLETVVAYLIDSKGMERKTATILSGIGISVISVISSLSMGAALGDFKLFGMNLFDLFDYVTANIMLLTCALIEVIFVGWAMKKEDFFSEVTNAGTLNFAAKNFAYLMLRYVIPVAIVILMLVNNGIFK